MNMGILKILHHMYSEFLQTSMEFSCSVNEDKEYLRNFPEPENDLERSFYQYLCQKRVCNSSFKWFLLNAMSGLMILPIKICFFMRANRMRQGDLHYDIVMTDDFIKNGYLVKESTESTKWNIKCLDNRYYEKGILTKEDLSFLKRIKSLYPNSFYFYFKCMCRIASYSEIIRRYTPKDLYVSAEYSFTSSVLTAYCEEKNVRHINVMHGEKAFYIRDAFSRFHIFYVWDDFYTELFHKLRADKTQYIVKRPYLPEIMSPCGMNKCTYYLQVHSLKELRKIKQCLEKINLKYKVRPHPVHMDKNIESIFGKEHMENPQEVSIWDSLKNTECVISVSSTVLLQAYWIKIPVIIDDLSNPSYMEELRLRNYIMFNKEYRLLSDVLKEQGNENTYD